MSAPRRAVFLDRDGVINVKLPDGQYVRSWRDFQFLPNIADWVRLFNAVDLLVIVVTNQRGIALGYMTEDDLQKIHRQMKEELSLRGARIDDIFYCPHAKDACDCRKPKSGMIQAAHDKWSIDVPNSLMIGDSESDRALAISCGMRFLMARAGQLVLE